MAPLPDRRASRQPDVAESASRTAPISGTSDCAGAVRSLWRSRQQFGESGGIRRMFVTGEACRPGEKGPVRARNTAGVESGMPGLTSTTAQGGSGGAGSMMSPTPPKYAGPAGQANRHIGAQTCRQRTERRVVRAYFPKAGQRPQGRGGVGRAAADAGCHGQALGQGDGDGGIGPADLSASKRAARVTRLSGCGSAAEPGRRDLRWSATGLRPNGRSRCPICRRRPQDCPARDSRRHAGQARADTGSAWPGACSVMTVEAVI